MAKVSITESVQSEDNLFYLQTSLGEILNHADCKMQFLNNGERAVLEIDCPTYYEDIIRTEILDKIAEVIAIKYKYDFFKSSIKMTGLSREQKEILYASLIAADFEEDKKYAYEKLKGSDLVAVDGTFNFRLKPLKNKWLEIASYMPECFFPSQLKDFISFLKENRKKRVYVDNGKVFDSHYRRLKRCALLGYDKLNVIREVILTNCGEVEINGPLPKEDENYLKEYYGNKIIFSVGYFG